MDFGFWISDFGFQCRRRRTRIVQSKIRNPKSKMGGYSFPEVLFAVVVLGIGFIMLAAVFPVALQQSKSTLDETRAAAIARANSG